MVRSWCASQLSKCSIPHPNCSRTVCISPSPNTTTPFIKNTGLAHPKWCLADARPCEIRLRMSHSSANSLLAVGDLRVQLLGQVHRPRLRLGLCPVMSDPSGQGGTRRQNDSFLQTGLACLCLTRRLEHLGPSRLICEVPDTASERDVTCERSVIFR